MSVAVCKCSETSDVMTSIQPHVGHCTSLLDANHSETELYQTDSTTGMSATTTNSSLSHISDLDDDDSCSSLSQDDWEVSQLSCGLSDAAADDEDDDDDEDTISNVSCSTIYRLIDTEKFTIIEMVSKSKW